MPRLPGRGDDLGVVAVGEHGTAPPRSRLAPADRGVEVLGGRDLEPLHAGCERILVIGLDDQVKMGALDAEVDDAEVFAPGGREGGFADRPVGEPAAQIADRADDPQHDVYGMPGDQRGPRLVR